MSGRTTAAALREAFDRSFAVAPAAARAPGEKLLRVRVGDAPFAVRLSEIAGVHAGRRIVSCPSEQPELLGIAGVRGRPVPVFSLAALLGIRSAGRPRWLLLAKRESEQSLGYAVDGLEGTLEARPEDLAEGESAAHVRVVLRVEKGVCGILEMKSLIAACARRTGSKER